MMEEKLGRCVASWCPGATGVVGVARLSGGASQETWSFDIVHPDGNIGAILRRAPPGYGASPSRAAGLGAEAVLMRLAHEAGVPSPRVMHVLQPQDGLGTGFIMARVEGETIARKVLRDEQFATARPMLARQLGKVAAGIHGLDLAQLPELRRMTAAKEIFELERDYYYHEGKQQGHYPTDAALGLEVGYTPALARLMCLEGADDSSYQKAETHLLETGGIEVSARQIQRVVQRVGVSAQAWQEREAQSGGSAVPIMYLSGDATGVPMRKEALRAQTRRAAEGTAHKLRTRLSKGEECRLTHKSATWAKICVTRAKWRRYASHSNYMFLL